MPRRSRPLYALLFLAVIAAGLASRRYPALLAYTVGVPAGALLKCLLLRQRPAPR